MGIVFFLPLSSDATFDVISNELVAIETGRNRNSRIGFIIEVPITTFWRVIITATTKKNNKIYLEFITFLSCF
ncbi:hypothetical protein K0A96_02920 [Patescibacteria group bacterium]|nr:hypothetical protein [Patescibacteria group bacterium]